MENHIAETPSLTPEQLAIQAPVTQTKLKKHVFICTGSSCGPRGSQAVLEKFQEVLRYKGLLYGKRALPSMREHGSVLVASCGSVGLCAIGPAVLVYPDGIWYYGVTPDDVEEIVNEHIIYGNPVKRLMACEMSQ